MRSYIIYSVLVVSCFIVPEVVFAVPTSDSLLGTTSVGVGIVHNNGSFLVSTSTTQLNPKGYIRTGVGGVNSADTYLEIIGSRASNSIQTENIIKLIRPLYALSYPNVATIKLGQWYATGVTSHSRLDIALKSGLSGSYDVDNLVMSLLSGTSGASQDVKVGIGSTSPWAQLSINPNGITGPSFAIGSSTRSLFVVTNMGNVGIGTTTPNQKLSVNGSVLADSYLEFSPSYIGDALSKIKNIGSEFSSIKADSDWAKVNHDTLPDGVRYEQQIYHPAVYGTTTRKVYYEELATTTDEIITDYKKVLSPAYTELFVGRDLGKQVQFNVRAIQQLLEKVELLEAKVEKLESATAIKK